jgi:predicted metal-dependent phosphoesterase TrpH
LTNPFEREGVWLRCALHAHTTNSDGEVTPEVLVRHYERAGFDVLAITDHRVRTEVESTSRLTVLPSAEIDARVGENGHRAHVLALGIVGDTSAAATEFPSVEAAAEWVTQSGGVAYLAHPYWSGLTPQEFLRCHALAGLEVYNAGCELEAGRGISSVHWDEVLEAGRPFLGIATDDTHHPGFDSGCAWTWVRARERTSAAVLEALREGAFYSSSGPRIEELAIEGRTVEVRCSPAQRVTLLTGRYRGASVGAGRLGYSFAAEALEWGPDGSIVAARLTAGENAPYARLEVKDARGETAWTNALWQ